MNAAILRELRIIGLLAPKISGMAARDKPFAECN
jgi:hypothetical protein